MNKIPMTTPLVEMDGDEMTHVLWGMIKDELLLPYVELKTVYFDLSLPHRDETADQVTRDAAAAALEYGVSVKCATITPNAQRKEEYSLREIWKSPNATIRAALDGTVFRTPIPVSFIPPAVRNWEKPITIARHAYGDVYKNVELRTDEGGVCELVFTGRSGRVQRVTVQELSVPGVFQGIHNREDSIRSFAHSCFRYALALKQDLWFGTKDTISKTYDGAFKEIMAQVYQEYAADFEANGLKYFYTLIDNAVAQTMLSKGGFIWACKNYDGDVMSDMVSAAFGSLAMMTSVLVSPSGAFEYEAAHGTVTDHYYQHLRGEETSTNPIATIYAWTGALKKRGELDSIPALISFGEALEGACMDALERGVMTGDLSPLAVGITPKTVTTREFIAAVKEALDKRLNG